MTKAAYLGFDPGGNGSFGWAVAARSTDASLRLLKADCAPNAKAALEAALSSLPTDSQVKGAGIDAPLFWTATGVRECDTTVRSELRRRGAPAPGGTVQQLNSLRGACLVQGVVAGMLLRKEMPDVRITETHPKALLWHLDIATDQLRARDVQMSHLSTFLLSDDLPDEHQRDAAISCIAAAAHCERWTRWHDLAEGERDAIHLVPGGVSYWMPIATAGA